MRCFAALLGAVIVLAAWPVAAAPTTRDLVEIAELSSLSVAPNGRVAVVREDRAEVTANGYALTWWAVDPLGRREPVRVGGAGGAMFSVAGTLEPETPQWAPDSAWFYYRTLVDGQVQVWRARPDGARLEPVTHDLADVVSFRIDPATGDIVYRTGEPRDAILAAETAEYDDGILVDASTEPGQAAFRGMLINGRMATQRLTGKWFDRRGLLGELPLHERRRRADGSVEALGRIPRDDAPPIAPAEVNEAGDTAFVTDPDSAARLSVRRAATAQVLSCEAAACRGSSVPGFRWIDGGRRVFFVARQPDRSHVLGVWDPANGRARKILAYAGTVGGRYRDHACGVAGGQALCILSAAVEPARLEAVDLASGRRNVLFDPNAAARPRVAMPVERLAWSAGGQDFYGVLFLPQGAPGGKPAPLFIQYYSCDGYIRGGEGDEYPMAVLAAQGVAALCVNSARIAGVTPESYDALHAYDVAVEGLRSMISTLVARDLVDPRRVGMGGLSFGSEVTMRMLAKTDLLRAASISSTQMEPIYYWYNSRPGRDFDRMAKQAWGIGAPDETPERWKEVSAALNAGKIDAALLMQLPEQESRYNYELRGRLAMRHVPVEMVMFPDEPHIKFQPRHKLAVYDRNLAWMRFWLQGVCDDASASCERWLGLASAWGR